MNAVKNQETKTNAHHSNVLYQKTKEWISEIQFWEDGIEVMERISKKQAAALSDQNSILELRELYGKITGDFSSQLKWLKNKIELLQARNQVKENKSENVLAFFNPLKEQSIERELEVLSDRYNEYRRRLFKLIKPI